MKEVETSLRNIRSEIKDRVVARQKERRTGQKDRLSHESCLEPARTESPDKEGARRKSNEENHEENEPEEEGEEEEEEEDYDEDDDEEEEEEEEEEDEKDEEERE